MTEPEHGTSGGVKLTAQQLEALVDEAARGYDPDRRQIRSRRGRPPMDAEAASVFHVRLPPALREALERAADDEQTTPSQVLRKALAQYLDGPSV